VDPNEFRLSAISNIKFNPLDSFEYDIYKDRGFKLCDYIMQFLQRTFRRLTATQAALQVQTACYRNHPVTD